MPCGGISPLVFGKSTPGGNCFTCGGYVEVAKGLFVEEWDAVIHRDCIAVFLSSAEGQIVVSHGHEIWLPEV